MFITFNTFVKALYDQRCQNKKINAIYEQAGGFKTFKKKYITASGFSDYLVNIRGTELTAIQTYHLAKIFVVYGKRSPSVLPNVLVSIARQYDLKYPSIDGILSKEYWQSRFYDCIYS